MAAFADKLRGWLSGESLSIVSATMGAAAMISLWVFNPTGNVSLTLIGLMLMVTIVSLSLNLVLFGSDDDIEIDERTPRQSVRRSLLGVATTTVSVAALVALCTLTAESIDLDETLLWLSVAGGVLWSAIDIIAEHNRSTDSDR